MSISISAHFFSILMIITIFFQLALVAGLPWGSLTLGGKYPGVLPKNRRWIPLVSMLLLLCFAFIVETRAGNMLPDWKKISEIAIWVVVAYCGLGVLANSATPSKWERRIWLPVVLLAFICSLIVALN
jgi:hypothetical protein